MASFTLHPLLTSLRPRVTALHQHGDRLYVGCVNGALQVYSFDAPGGGDGFPTVKLVKTYSWAKKAIDQIGVLGESNQLAVLSDSMITLYSLPDLPKSSANVLSQARNAHTFAITSYTATISKKKSQADLNSGEGKKIRRDLLVVACRKKVVVYGAGRGGLKEGWDMSLPHSPRHAIFPSVPSSSTTLPLPETIHLLYSPQSSVLLHIHPTSSQRLSISDVTTGPTPVSHSSVPASLVASAAAGATSAANTTEASSSGSGGLSMGMGGMSALTGLGGYVGLGGKAALPVGTSLVGGEVLLARENVGVFLSTEGNYSRPESLQWPGPPEAISFSNPYIYSLVPIVTTASASSSSTSASHAQALQVHVAPTLALRQSLSFPAPAVGGLTVGELTHVSGTSPATPAEAMLTATKVLMVSTPTDKALSQSEGSSIWALRAGHVGEQIDELIREGRLADAIGLVEAVGEDGLSPARRLTHLRTLSAVQHCARGHYQPAMDTFLMFNINPALIISLYPAETISGKLHVLRDQWMRLFGGVEDARLEPEVPMVTEGSEGGSKSLKSMAHLSAARKPSLDTLRTVKDDDAASISSTENSAPIMSGEESVAPRAALEALMYFLSDRRQKLTGAIAALPTPLPAESSLPPLSSLPATELHALPSVPFAQLEPEQLLRMAQVIYTALLKVYLVARPVLVGSLCRIENWCDVEEVEELLKAQKKFGDLIDLYQGKKMHAKALKMLHELAKDEQDRLDRYPPTVRYLQKLGPAELPLILETSRWIFDEDQMMALQVFTADEPEVESLPRLEVMKFIETTSPDASTGYLEHVINVWEEKRAEFHDKLAELYLSKARVASPDRKDDGSTEEYSELLNFLSTSTHYRPHRLISKLPGDEMPEARAMLLGRMGNHEEALRIYVHRLNDYLGAEAYCSKVYAKSPDPHGIFLLLLRIYLRPSPSSQDPILLIPALSFIAKHGVQLDANEVLALLPPLVTMDDVRFFLIRTLRDGFAKRNEHRVVKQLVGARKEDVERVSLGLQVKRVRVTDQRICPQCQKRLGQSAIAVHSPRGEVTHLHCKDPFSATLARIRG